MDGGLRVVLAGGGTGGHTFPALAVARELRARHGESVPLLWVGQADSLEERTAASDDIEFTAVAVGKIRRDRRPWRMVNRANLSDVGRVPTGIAQAVRALRAFNPDVVLATGGYVAAPVGVAAWLTGVPLVVHEQTTGLGLANRMLSPIAARIALTSPSTLAAVPRARRQRATVTGNPVRAQVLAAMASRVFDTIGAGFDRALPTVLITGGAQGAREINRAVAEVLPWLVEHANVIHQAGGADLHWLRDRADALGPRLGMRYYATDFLHSEYADALALAELVVSRSGAGIVAELTALGRPAVLVPLASSAGGEQARSAQVLSDAGAATVVTGGLTGSSLKAAVGPLLADPRARTTMAVHSRALGRPDATERLTDVVTATATPVRWPS